MTWAETHSGTLATIVIGGTFLIIGLIYFIIEKFKVKVRLTRAEKLYLKKHPTLPGWRQRAQSESSDNSDSATAGGDRQSSFGGGSSGGAGSSSSW